MLTYYRYIEPIKKKYEDDDDVIDEAEEAPT